MAKSNNVLAGPQVWPATGHDDIEGTVRDVGNAFCGNQPLNKDMTAPQVAYFLWACMEWHSIPAGMECSFHLEWNGPFHSSRNGVAVVHSARNRMGIPFLQEWNE